MAIFFDPCTKLFTIETKNTAYQMKIDRYGYLLHLYYGRKVEQSMDYLLTYQDRGFSGNPAEDAQNRVYSLDVLPQEYPFWGSGDYRNVALWTENPDNTLGNCLTYEAHEILPGKYSLADLPGAYGNETEADTLRIVMCDKMNGLRVILLYGVFADADVITKSVILENKGETKLVIRKAASSVLDFISGEYDLVHFQGRHAMERNRERQPVQHTGMAIGSRRGTSSHQHNPGLILCEPSATETSGSVYGTLLSYSGGFKAEVEKDQFEQTRLVMGISDELFAYPLQPGDRLELPECIHAYSSGGFGALSRIYHDFIRSHVLPSRFKEKKRPVLLNSWEASYFDFTGDTIVALAREAQALGIDLLVMDDGWFGKRDDDNSGLGDWQVNEEKLGCTLGEMIQKVNDLGVDFGIWVEPEMISEDSDLYRSHPDWALRMQGREPVRSRNQLVLDFSRKDVREEIFSQICAVLDQGNITYLKWDMNRSLADIGSAVNLPGTVLYRYMTGVYEFLRRLEERYPDLLIEGCSGGGGRFDTGMLAYTPQIWCSDNTDAIDRLRIQYGTSFFYPVSTVGAHVSAAPNHQTGRCTSLNVRGCVAMAGTFGYELDPALLSDEEKQEIREQIVTYKKLQTLIFTGDYYRLSDPFTDNFAAWNIVSKDRTECVITVVILENHANMAVNYIRAAGLDPEMIYEDQNGNRYQGAALMYGGIPVTSPMKDHAAYQFIFRGYHEQR